MPDVEWNKETWDRGHDWKSHGDEWTGMAEYCKQPYELWKSTLIEELLLPNLTHETRALEVAPGHGRFTSAIVAQSRTTVLVDISPTCLDYCHARFGDGRVRYIQTEGRSFPGVDDSTVDFIWSFDSFVHMELDVIDAYMGEFHRVLAPGGHFVIHHAGKRALALKLAPATLRLGRLGRVAHRLLSQGRLRDSGRRSEISKQDVARLATSHGLRVDSQRQTWGNLDQFTVTKYGDWITSGSQPN